MKCVKLLLFFVILQGYSLKSQTHWVVFADKSGVTFNPWEYFDMKAIERRVSIGYNLFDFSDFPVNESYISGVTELCDSVSYSSRWMNAVSVWAEDDALRSIAKLDYVMEIIPIEQEMSVCGKESLQSKIDTTILRNQLLVMQGDLFRKAGIDGSGVRVAVFDGGFPDVDTHMAFEHIRKDGRIIKTWDFVKDREFVYNYSNHGTMVLSCIAGIYNGQAMGLATGAEFLLARTERNSEPYSEEVSWVAALEWADRNGADVVNSSLGYTYHRYFPYQMDGKTSFVSKMANTAASKGILVVNAAGNDGDSEWTIIGAPADADSILSVGGINPYTDYRISFSSVGPTADFRRKPNVTAYGQAIVAGKNGLSSAYGTSFASPLVAGFAACAKQVFPLKNAIELKEIIEQSGNLYPYFDYAHGYGVPQASFILDPDIELSPTFTIKQQGNSWDFEVSSHLEFDEETAKEEKYDNYLYFAFVTDHGIVCEWGIIHVKKGSFSLTLGNGCEGTQTLQLHYRGYTIDINMGVNDEE
jgi:serine protease AprX